MMYVPEDKDKPIKILQKPRPIRKQVLKEVFEAESENSFTIELVRNIKLDGIELYMIEKISNLDQNEIKFENNTRIYSATNKKIKGPALLILNQQSNFLCKLFRPELLKKLNFPLSSDSCSNFELDILQSKKEVHQARMILFTQVIPNFVRLINSYSIIVKNARHLVHLYFLFFAFISTFLSFLLHHQFASSFKILFVIFIKP
jgi:hypothetical protein